jgi:hypothetical protein
MGLFSKPTPAASNHLVVIDEISNFNLYPVPTYDKLNISLPALEEQQLQIIVSDMLGKVVLSQEVRYEKEKL